MFFRRFQKFQRLLLFLLTHIIPKDFAKKIHGIFDIEIHMDGPGDLMDFKSPTKKAKQSSEASTSSSGLKRGRVPLPYEEKSERGQFRDAAALGNGQNPNALYHAAYSNIS